MAKNNPLIPKIADGFRPNSLDGLDKLVPKLPKPGKTDKITTSIVDIDKLRPGSQGSGGDPSGSGGDSDGSKEIS